MESKLLFGDDFFARKSHQELGLSSVAPYHPLEPNELKFNMMLGSPDWGLPNCIKLVGGTHDQPQMLHHYSSLAFGSNTDLTGL